MPIKEQTVIALRYHLIHHIVRQRYLVASESEEEICRRMPITYGGLIQFAGLNLPARGIGKHLTIIGDRCEEDGTPRLDYLVVSKKTNRPGRAVSETDWAKEVVLCYHSKAYA